MNRLALLLFVTVVVGSFQWWAHREESHPAGILVAMIPFQKDLSATGKVIKYKDVVLESLAEFSIEARVLSTQSYWIDEMASISPRDFALGWGVMSDSSLIEKLNIRQANRFYFYNWQGDPPADANLIAQSSTNVHLIPSNDFIEGELSKVRKGNIVKLAGNLVRVNFKNGTEVKSSMSRSDSGARACEVLYVRSISVNH